MLHGATDIQVVSGGARGCGTSSASRSPTQALPALPRLQTTSRSLPSTVPRRLNPRVVLRPCSQKDTTALSTIRSCPSHQSLVYRFGTAEAQIQREFPLIFSARAEKNGLGRGGRPWGAEAKGGPLTRAHNVPAGVGGTNGRHPEQAVRSQGPTISRAKYRQDQKP